MIYRHFTGMNFLKQLWLEHKIATYSFWVTLGCFVATYFLAGFYYVEYEGLITSFISGKLTGGMPFRSIHFLGHIGTSYIYSYLYELFPNVEWLSFFYYSYLFIACYIGLYLVAKLSPQNITIRNKVLIQLGVYILVFADHNIHLIYTRVAYMLSGLTLIALVVLFPSWSEVKNKPAGFVVLNLLFTLGCLTRLESATACLSVVFCFSIFYINNIKQSIVTLLYPIALVLMMITAISLDIKNATEFYKQVEPDIEAQFIERENRVPLSAMKTQRDSVIYRAIDQMMWSDPAVISPAYLRSLIMPENILFTDARQWKRVTRNVTKVVKTYWLLPLIFVLLAFAVLMSYDFAGSRWQYLTWMGFELSFWVLLLIQTYVFKVNERSFTTLLSVFIFCHLVILLRNLPGRYLKVTLFISVFVLSMHSYYLTADVKNLRKNLNDYVSNFKVIKSVADNRYLVLNASSFDYIFLSNKPFHPFNFHGFKSLYIPDGYVIPFMPYYRRFLESECKCDIEAFPSFWNYLKSKGNEVIIVSLPERIEVIGDYLRLIKKSGIKFRRNNLVELKELKKTDFNNHYSDFGVYYIE